MINGIELLKKIKNNELKLNQKINVYYDNKDVAYDLVAILTYKGNEVIWSENTFRFSMLYDDNYLFEIIEDKSIIEKINGGIITSRAVYTNFNDVFKDMSKSYETIDDIIIKLNEVIDYINRREDK